MPDWLIVALFLAVFLIPTVVMLLLVWSRLSLARSEWKLAKVRKAQARAIDAYLAEQQQRQDQGDQDQTGEQKG